MVTYSISKTNADIGETITLSRSDNVQAVNITFWVIDLQPSDYGFALSTPLSSTKCLANIGKLFATQSPLSMTVTIEDNHTIAHTLTPITVSTPSTQYISSVYTTPLYQLQGTPNITVDIGEPIEVNFNRNIYNQLKYLVNRWTKGKGETKLDKLQRTVTTFNPIDYVVGENGAVWDNDNSITLPNNGSNITFNFTDMLNDTGDYFEWELRVSHGTTYIRDEENRDEIWDSSANPTIRIRITKNEYSDSYHITTTDLSNNTIIRDYDKDYHFNLTFSSLNGCTFYFSNKKWYHTVSFIDMIYPIGSIYMSVNSINPSLFIGGTWEQIKDKFLLSSGDTYSNGATGGSATVTLTENEMPSHTHTQQSHSHTNTDGNFVTSDQSNANNTRVAYSSSGNRMVDGFNTTNSIFHHRPATTGTTAINNATGGGQSHENMPPYIVVNVWKRIA